MGSEEHGRFEFYGGHPALDFINTVWSRGREQPIELLGTYADLLRWARQARLIDDDRASQLARQAAEKGRAAAATMRRARALREAGFRLFGALIDGTAPAGSDLELLNRHARKAKRGGAVRWDDGKFLIDTPAPLPELDEPLHRVTRGIVEVLTGEHSAHVSICRDAACLWLFLDRSPARARRWCSMSDCGNRAKARRHYEKRKAAAAG